MYYLFYYYVNSTRNSYCLVYLRSMKLNAINYYKGSKMREEIRESVKRLTKADMKDIQITFNLASCGRGFILSIALLDEEIAEYVLQY